MSNQTIRKPLFTIAAPKDLPTFEVYGRTFHALGASGYELEEIEKLKDELDGNEQEVLKDKVALLAGILAKRAVIKSEDGFTPDPDPPSADWYWQTLSIDQLAELVRAFTGVIEAGAKSQVTAE